MNHRSPAQKPQPAPERPTGAAGFRHRFHALNQLGASALGRLARAPAPMPAPAAEIPADALERALQALLLTRPELLRDALNKLQRRDADAAARRAREGLVRSAQEACSELGATLLGQGVGDVTVRVFVDYGSPECRRQWAVIDALMQHEGPLRVLVMHLPGAAIESLAAARLMLALGPGSAAQALHRALMDAPDLDAMLLHGLAQRVGLPERDARAFGPALEHVRALADKLHIRTAPALQVGATVFPAATELAPLRAALAAARRQRAHTRP